MQKVIFDQIQFSYIVVFQHIKNMREKMLVIFGNAVKKE